MANSSRVLWLGFLSLIHLTSVAASPCPDMPPAINHVSHNIRSDIKLAVGKLGPVGAADIAIKTEVTAQDLLTKYTNVEPLFALQVMSSTYCSLLEKSGIADLERLDRWERFQDKVLKLQQPTVGTSPPSVAPKPSTSDSLKPSTVVSMAPIFRSAPDAASIIPSPYRWDPKETPPVPQEVLDGLKIPVGMELRAAEIAGWTYANLHPISASDCFKTCAAQSNCLAADWSTYGVAKGQPGCRLMSRDLRTYPYHSPSSIFAIRSGAKVVQGDQR